MLFVRATGVRPVYAATYPMSRPRGQSLDTIEHLGKEVAGMSTRPWSTRRTARRTWSSGWTTRTSASSPSGSAAGLLTRKELE